MTKLKLLIEGKQLAYMAGRTLARNYSSFSSIAPTSKIDSQMHDVYQEMGKHRALHHPLFEYLEEQSQKGFTPQQFALHRDNFFYRTWQTIPSVARVIIAAAANHDIETLASTGKNIFEETGEGTPAYGHSLLLERSHNIHAQTVFGLPEQKLKKAKQSSLIVPAVHTFVHKQLELYTSPSYPAVLGTGFAHEFAADPMLRHFYESYFLPYKGFYSPTEFSSVSKYFDVHLNGTEERHAADAQEAIKRACKTPEDVNSMREAAFAFLDIQANLWDGMLHSSRQAASAGKIIEVRPEFLSTEQRHQKALYPAISRTSNGNSR